MRKYYLPIFIILSITLASCKFQCNVGKTSDQADEGIGNKTTSSNNENQSKTDNNIEINTSGVNVSTAYLTSENGNRIPTDNTIPLGEQIVLKIECSGWQKIDGKSFIGISQNIFTNTGVSVLDTGDMFAKYDETGINAEYANHLKLKAYITETKPEIQYFMVEFRVWDKKGNGEIKGKYKFYVK